MSSPRSGSGHLLPPYARGRRTYYPAADMVPSDDSDSDNDAESVMQMLRDFLSSSESSKAIEKENLHAKKLLKDLTITQLDFTPDMNSQNGNIIRLCLRRNQLLIDYPAMSRTILALAYAAGLYKIKGEAGYDPRMNSFFKHHADESSVKIPDAVKEFSAELEAFSNMRYHSSVKFRSNPSE